MIGMHGDNGTIVMISFLDRLQVMEVKAVHTCMA